MKLALARADLHRALALVGRAIERRNTIPILSNLRLQAVPGRLTVTGTDLDIMLETTVPADVQVQGATTVQAATLAGYVAKLPDGGQVTIDATGEGQAKVKSGRAQATLPTLHPADFPDLDVGPDFTLRFDISGAELHALLDPIAFAISTEETRYYLNGIYLHAVAGEGGLQLRAAATDGHRLGRAGMTLPDAAAGMPGVIVPKKAVAEILRLAEAADALPVTVELSSAKIRVTTGGDEDGDAGTRLVSKLIDGTFPDYQRVIPTANGLLATIQGSELATAIDRVAAVSSERGRAIKLDFADGLLTLRMNNPDQGQAEEEIACGYDAPTLTIGFNARYALDILKALGPGEIQVAMAGPGSPSIWTSSAAESRLYVLMPMLV